MEKGEFGHMAKRINVTDKKKQGPNSFQHFHQQLRFNHLGRSLATISITHHEAAYRHIVTNPGTRLGPPSGRSDRGFQSRSAKLLLHRMEMQK